MPIRYTKFAVFAVIMNMIVLSLITKALFGTTVSGTGYDDMDFYSAAGAFYNATQAASVVPCLLLAAIIVCFRGGRSDGSVFSGASL